MKQIIYYEKENWKIPVKIIINFLNKNNEKMLSKFYYKLDLLKFDLLWKEDIKYIKNNIYELRIRDESNISRFFYFSYSFNKIIILDWFIKKDNKLKNNILSKIINYKNDYIKRIWKL